jgi:homoserine O-acetyltransferase/O-succinyltransferase
MTSEGLNMSRFLVVVILALSAAAYAADPIEHDFLVKDFRFDSGETLPEVRIHYLTYGTPGKPAVLVLHGTGGSSRQFVSENFAGFLFKPGGLLDATRYFIVIPDNVGHGKSSKPSDGLGRKFPHYDYADMTELQHRLLADGLGIHHVFLVIGTSMGAMHTWMWGERWPDMMDALVPLASLPAQIAGRNRVWRKMIIDDLERNDVQAAIQILMIATSSPLQWQKTNPTRDEADKWLESQMRTRLASTDANDLLYAIEASRDYDPSTQLERITAPLLAINSADDFVNPPELGIMESLIKRVKHGTFVLLPITGQTRGHGTHTLPAVWHTYVEQFLGSLAH